MQIEITALETNVTWDLEHLLPVKHFINSKCVYKIKCNVDGTVERFKAWLVIKGFTQVEGIVYTYTFALIAKITSVRCLLAVATIKGWKLHQLVVNNDFLHGDLNKKIYMKILMGFYKPCDTHVCCLHNSLYGLK
jgi:hypothetical protein